RHRLPGRDDQVVGGDDLGLAVAVEVVAVLPPPLVADHGDLERPVGVVLEVEDREHRGDGHTGEDERRQDRPADLELEVAVGLGGELVVAGAAAEVPGDGEGADLDAEEDDGGDPEHRVDEVIDHPGVGPGRIERVERRVLGAGAEQEEGRRSEGVAEATGHSGSSSGARGAGHQPSPSAVVVAARFVPSGVYGVSSFSCGSWGWISRSPMEAVTTPAASTAAAVRARTPATTSREMRGLAASSQPRPSTTTPRIDAAHTAPSFDEVRKMREKAHTPAATA